MILFFFFNRVVVIYNYCIISLDTIHLQSGKFSMTNWKCTDFCTLTNLQLFRKRLLNSGISGVYMHWEFWALWKRWGNADPTTWKLFCHNFLSSLAAAHKMTKVNANARVFSTCGLQTYYSHTAATHMETDTPLRWCSMTWHDERGREALFDHLILKS